MKDVKDREGHKRNNQHDGTFCVVCKTKFKDPVRGSYCPKCLPIYIIPENRSYKA